MKSNSVLVPVWIACLTGLVTIASGQQTGQRPVPDDQPERHRHDQLLKAIDDLMWHLKLGDIAEVDKVRYTSRPARRQPNPTAQGAGNPLIIPAYTFIPKKLDRSRKHPLIVLVHGGVHANFNTGSARIVRELIEQGYAIIAPEYRGSTGYGANFYRQIDYGGWENDDVLAGRNWMLETYDFLDPKRVGIVGWSHGGMIALMNIFEHPEAYACAYAGVPVTDLVARMGYKTEAYRAQFSAPYHIGKTPWEDLQEYLRRSPVTHAHKLSIPLLIHANTSDEDVNVFEVERLIAALKAAGKKFEYKIYQDAPGGHAFNRIDTRLARQSRREIYEFLARYLKPGQ
ncbi:MAG: alpha/beta fold hydrolase [Bryobacterales bacterium]|nr:alpha/beta fold hydrolase [Bryobacteraceae bacterium]MDW8131076.1 alpha/beta fold hydrolase [Bryobacterales bacterium]